MKFVSYEIQGVVDDGEDCYTVEDDADAQFFSIYGRDDQGFAHCIGDFVSRQAAEEVKAAIESGP